MFCQENEQHPPRERGDFSIPVLRCWNADRLVRGRAHPTHLNADSRNARALTAAACAFTFGRPLQARCPRKDKPCPT